MFNDERTRCPACRKAVDEKAIICPYCRTQLVGAPVAQAVPRSAADLSRRFYFARSEEVLGPYELRELLRMKMAGEIYPHTQVCREGGEHWTTLGELGV